MKLASSSREAMRPRGDLVSTETGGNVWDLGLSPPGSEDMGWGSQDLIGLLPAQPVRADALPSLTIPADLRSPPCCPNLAYTCLSSSFAAQVT